MRIGLAALVVVACAWPADEQDRARALGLVTLDVKDEPLADVLRKVAEQTREDLRIGRGVDGATRVTIQAKETPFHEFLIQLCKTVGCSWLHGTDEQGDTHWELAGKWDGPPSWSITPGAAFRFSGRAFGEGTVLTARPFTTPGASVRGRFEKVVDAQGKELSIERCGRCGDSNVYVPAKLADGWKVVFAGRRFWDLESRHALKDPARTEILGVGDYEIHYEYPKVTVKSARPVSSPEFPSARLHGVLSADGKPVKWTPSFPTDFLSYAPKRKSWCFCAAGPTPEPREIPSFTSQTFKSPAYAERKAGDFRTLEIILVRPVSEAMTVEGKVIAY